MSLVEFALLGHCVSYKMVMNHPQLMSWNVGIKKKRLNPDPTLLLQNHIIVTPKNETMC